MLRDESPIFGSEAPGAPTFRCMTTSVRNVGPEAPIRLSNLLLLTSFITV